MCLDAELLTSYLAQLQTCMYASVYDPILASTHVQIWRVSPGREISGPLKTQFYHTTSRREVM